MMKKQIGYAGECQLDKETSAVLKGLAIVCIMASHCGSWIDLSVVSHMLFALGGIGVAVFLFLSAYGLVKSYERNGLHGFWRKRILSIWVSYVMISIPGYFVTGWVHEPIDVVLDLLLIRSLNPLGWYMTFIIVCYAEFYVLYRFVKYRNLRWILLGIASVAIFCFGSDLWAQQAVSFLAGLLVAEFGIIAGGGIPTVAVVAVSVALRQILHDSVPVRLIVLFQMIYCLGTGLVFIRIALKKMFNWKWQAFVGGISYQLYLLHGYWEYFVRNRGLTGVPIMAICCIAVGWVVKRVSDWIQGFALKKIH